MWIHEGGQFQRSQPIPVASERSEGIDSMAVRTTKTAFLFTVDVESRLPGGPDRDILGVLPGQRERFGIERMMDLLESEQVRGTFFLNVYEVARHRDNSIAEIAKLIHLRGHDLQLHTHPRPMYRYYGMNHASFEEQVAILEKGISLIQGWTGKRVVAHRAGAFAANGATLRAVETTGLTADSSLSAGSRVAVPLVKEFGASNRSQRVGKILEIPVTYFEQIRIGSWCSRRALDIEGCSLAEIKRVTRWAARSGLPSVCILSHSFSFSRQGKPNWRAIRRMAALLAWLRQQDDIEICTVEQFCRWPVAGAPPQKATDAPLTGFWRTWCRALGSWNDGWKNLLVATAGVVGLGVLVLVLAWLGYSLFLWR